MKRTGNMIWTVLTQVFGCIVLIHRGKEFSGRLTFGNNWVRIRIPNNLGKYILKMFHSVSNPEYPTIGYVRGPWRTDGVPNNTQFCVFFAARSNFSFSIEKGKGKTEKERYFISGPKNLIVSFLKDLVSF